MTTRRLLPALGVALLSTSPVLAAANAPVFSLWKTDDGAALVRIAPCGQKLCGTVAQVLDPKAPPNDINNPDPAARTAARQDDLAGFRRRRLRMEIRQGL